MFTREIRLLVRITLVAVALLTGLGSALLGAAFLAGPLGLGFNEGFVLYAWLGLSRRWAAYLGVVLLASALGVLVLAWLGQWVLREGRRAEGGLSAASIRTALFRAAQNVGLVLSSLLLGVLALEFVVRATDDVPLWPPRNLMAERAALLTVHTLNDYHPVLGWVLKSELRFNPDSPEMSFTTGDHGVRMNSALLRPLPSGGLLAVGDSFTAGSEVGDRHSWPAHLERILGEPVVNGGVGAWGTDQIVLRAEELIPIIRPHTVIVSFFADDIQRTGYRIYGGGSKPWFSVENGELVQHNVPVQVFTGQVDEVDSLFGYLHLATWTLERIGYGDWWRQSNASYIRADNDPERVSCLLLERLKHQTIEIGVRLLLLIQHGGSDAFAKLSKPEDVKAVLACARAAGVEVIDSWDALVRVHKEDMEAYRGLYVMHDEGRIYGHMSSDGNAFVARLIEERLRRGRH